ncbi:MAG: CoA pyrophosphatase [Bacteroidota bacterium]
MNPSDLPQFISRLQQRFLSPLPGKAAQAMLTSRPIEDRLTPPPPNHRKGGVLALLYPSGDEISIVFMKRTEDGKVHSGQISFPGGKVESFDASPMQAAVREAEEELGIPQSEVHIIGQLSTLYIPPSNFLVYPFVGYMDHAPNFVPSHLEVAKVIEVPLPTLLEPQMLQQVAIKVRQNLNIQAPAFIPDGHVIWGATAMILNELLVLIRELEPI